MFTGIVQACCPVTDCKREGDILTYSVILPDHLVQGVELGASVAIDGVCQTVTLVENNQVFFDAIPETLRVTTLAELKKDQLVNVERSLSYGSEVGGHLVSGHVMALGTITSIVKKNHSQDWVLQIPEEAQKFVIPKGFIAINGASLTVGRVEGSQFTIHLIPETLERTNLQFLQEGACVNIEFDQQTVAIVETIERILEARSLP